MEEDLCQAAGAPIWELVIEQADHVRKSSRHQVQQCSWQGYTTGGRLLPTCSGLLKMTLGGMRARALGGRPLPRRPPPTATSSCNSVNSSFAGLDGY